MTSSETGRVNGCNSLFAEYTSIDNDCTPTTASSIIQRMWLATPTVLWHSKKGFVILTIVLGENSHNC